MKRESENVWGSIPADVLRTICEDAGLASGGRIPKAGLVDALVGKGIDPSQAFARLPRVVLDSLAKSARLLGTSRKRKTELAAVLVSHLLTKAIPPPPSKEPRASSSLKSRPKRKSEEAVQAERGGGRQKRQKVEANDLRARMVRLLPEIVRCAESLPPADVLTGSIRGSTSGDHLVRQWQRRHENLTTWLRARIAETEEEATAALKNRIVKIAEERFVATFADSQDAGLFLDTMRERELTTLHLLTASLPPPLRERPYRERQAVVSLLASVLGRTSRDTKRAADTVERIAKSLHLKPVDVQKNRRLLERPESLTKLASMIQSAAVRRQVVSGLLLEAVQDSEYRPSEREAIRSIAGLFQLPWSEAEVLEAEVAEAAHEAVKRTSKTSGPKLNVESEGRSWKIPLAVLAGALVLAATGGLAAPAIGGAIGTYGMGLTGVAATNAGLAALGAGSLAAGGFGMAGGAVTVSALFGASGGYVFGRAVARRTGGLSNFSIGAPNGMSSHVWVGASGFLTADRNFAAEWAPLRDASRSAEVRAVEWEPQALRDLGSLLTTLMLKQGFKELVKQLSRSASKNAWRGLAAPVAILQLMGAIDNPWHIARDRSRKAGLELAWYLRNQALGKRPVSLIGHSLGGNLVLTALGDLARTGHDDLVHDVVLLGAASSPTKDQWQAASEVVSGRFVNTYCRTDGILAYLYRAAQFESYVAGLEPAPVSTVTSLDVTTLVGSHTGYRDQLPAIFDRINALRARTR